MFLSRFLLGLLAVGILLSAGSFLVADSWGWSNGGYSSDPADPDYGTHDWIAEHALDWLPAEEKQYILDNLAAYLYGTELPDNGGAPDGIGDTTKHHIYYNSAEVMTDDVAAVRASTEYGNALSFLEAKDFTGAAKTAGIMSHYIVDVAVFGHVMGAATDWGAETHHSDYETYVNTRTSVYTAEFNSYLSFDGSLQTISAYDAAKSLAYDTTFDVDGPLTCVWMDQNYDWNNPTFKNRAGESLNLAVNCLTDVLHMLSQVSPITVDDYDGLWHTTDFAITLTATDSISGVADTYYKLNDGPTKTVLVDGHPSITVEAADNKLEYWSIDNAGNEESHHILNGIRLDKTAPVGSIIINNGAAYTASDSVTLTLTSEDEISGVAQMRFSNNETTWTSWEAYSAAKTWVLTASDGTRTVYCQIKDNAGLTSSTYSDTIVLDTALPAVSITSPIHGYEIKSSTLTVTWTGADETSGISHYEISLDGGPLGDVGTDTTYTLTGLADGTHTVTVTAVDKAGHGTSDTVAFMVNTSPVGGPGYMEEGGIAAALLIIALGIIGYVMGKRGKR